MPVAVRQHARRHQEAEPVRGRLGGGLLDHRRFDAGQIGHREHPAFGQRRAPQGDDLGRHHLQTAEHLPERRPYPLEQDFQLVTGPRRSTYRRGVIRTHQIPPYLIPP
ncbi:hypothetical protein TBS_07400 [Thermobispora bispora]